MRLSAVQTYPGEPRLFRQSPVRYHSFSLRSLPFTGQAADSRPPLLSARISGDVFFLQARTLEVGRRQVLQQSQ